MIGVMQLSGLAEPLRGKLQGGDCSFTRLSTDTRTLRKSELYLALSGENFDGNDFLAAALERGACGAIVSRPGDVDIPQLVVGNTLMSLGEIARINRRRSSAHVVALTGSQGKTTVKEMIGSILRQRHSTLVTRGNLNNRIGAPLTLLELDDTHQFAVIELGANGAGEISDTVSVALPQVVLITNATATHLEGFGSVDGVVRAKGEIIDGCAEDGVVVLNADDAAFETWARRAGQRRVAGFSLDHNHPLASYSCAAVRLDATSSQFTLRFPEGETDITLPMPGRHNIANALAAAAVAMESGISKEDVVAGLARMSAVPGRLDVSLAKNDMVLIDDSYNASPSSFRAAIDVLVALGRKRNARTMVVAGDMAELGEDTAELHRGCGEYARKKGVDMLLCTGRLSALMADAFGDGAQHFDDREALMAHVVSLAEPDLVMLVKGSRSAGMDRIVEQLKVGEAC